VRRRLPFKNWFHNLPPNMSLSPLLRPQSPVDSAYGSSLPTSPVVSTSNDAAILLNGLRKSPAVNDSIVLGTSVKTGDFEELSFLFTITDFKANTTVHVKLSQEVLAPHVSLQPKFKGLFSETIPYADKICESVLAIAVFYELLFVIPVMANDLLQWNYGVNEKAVNSLLQLVLKGLCLLYTIICAVGFTAGWTG